MEYNKTRKKLAIPEYGRNIQLLIDDLFNIKDQDQLDRAVKAVITIMGNMNPHLRDVPDFKHKLWDHLAIMSDFKLNFNSPYPMPQPKDLNSKLARIPYNDGEIKHKHFGRIVENLIKKAEEITDEDARRELIKAITNHMKKSYLMWNKENVSDEVIFEALKDMSHGKLTVEESDDIKLFDSQDFITPKRMQNRSNAAPVNGNLINGNNNSNSSNNSSGNNQRRQFKFQRNYKKNSGNH